ncbi:MAG: IclR family transcriptional regulator [Anaerolineae bacterium]
MPVVNSVTKALDILELFSSEGTWLTLGEMASRLGFPRSTTHALLQTLVSRGYIEKTDDGRYALGTGVIPLTQAVRVNVELRDRAAPLLRELAIVCHESVYLTVLDRDHVLYIYAIETPQRLLARTAVGDRVTPHCTAVGKAMLSTLTDDQVISILNRTGLARYTPNTITDIEALLADVDLTRRLGYAVDEQEHEIGIRCVGAPILGAQKGVVGACSVSGGMDLDQADFASRVVQTAQEISRRMGYVPSRSRAVPSLPAIIPEGGASSGRI